MENGASSVSVWAVTASCHLLFLVFRSHTSVARANAATVADLYPNATFQGLDLSPIQPDWVPQNVSFVVDDIEHEAGWTYDDNMFDYIHVRHIMHSIRDRKELFERIYK